MARFRDWRHARGGPDPHEHPLLVRSRHWINTRGVAFALSWGVVIAGVWAEFDSDRLRVASGRAWHNLVAVFRTWSPHPLASAPDWPTVLFWLMLLLIATTLWKRLKADDQKQDERVLEVLRALYRSPNINVVRYYPRYWKAFTNELSRAWPSDDRPAGERREAMAASIRGALSVIAALARDFARGEQASYGANVMLIIARNSRGGPAFPAPLVEKLAFHSRGALDDLDGLLYLPAELLVANLPGASERSIALISLPVPQTDVDEGGHRLVIPGAPAAAITGEPSVHEDAREIATECADFAAPVRSAIARYFSPGGAGTDVLSFASFRLGDETSPVGVLNIDSNRTHVLGIEPQFYISFYALLRPMLDYLAETVAEYAALIGSELPLPEGDGPPAAASLADPSPAQRPPHPPGSQDCSQEAETVS